MILVTNLSFGRVQIRSRGRSTESGATELVDVIDSRLHRLREAGLVSWPDEAASEKAAPADAPKPKPVVAADIPPPKVEPVAAVEPEPVAAVEPEPVAAVEPEPEPEPEPEDEPEPEPEPEPEDEDEDERITAERERLNSEGWPALRAEAKNMGVRGRGRETIEQRMLEAFIASLA